MFIFNRKKIGKKAYSPGFSWLLGLVLIFSLGVVYIIFNQVFTAHLVPTAKNLVNVSTIPGATQIIINASIDKYIAFWNMLPFILLFVIIIYMILTAMRGEQEI